MRFALLSLLLLTACVPNRLKVRIERLNQNHLASSFVDSPDPLRNSRFCGQWMVIQWNLPRSCPKDLFLHLQLVRGDHCLHSLNRKLPCKRGTTALYFLGSDYKCHGPVLTWKAQIFDCQGRLIACKQSIPWIEWIDDTKD